MKRENKGADAKVEVASNGSVAPNAHTTKSLKSTSVNGREAELTEVIIPHNLLLRLLADDNLWFLVTY